MIAKKNSGVDLEKNRSILIQIGLLTAGSFTLAAFTYRTPTSSDEEFRRVGTHEVIYEIQEVEKTKEIEEIKPDPVVQQLPEPSLNAQMNPNENILEKKNETLGPPDATPGMDDIGYKFSGEDIIGTSSIEGEIIEFPPVDAEYIGGYEAMIKHINSKVEYPDISLSLGHQGTVGVSFVVEKDGSVTNIMVENKVTPELDREAKRIVRSFPKWKPAEVDFSPVRARVRLPITFILVK